jgi:4-carboxymuconolactone decarboxylase
MRTKIMGAALAIAFSACAADRLPTIDPAKYNADQKQAAEEFLAARKVAVFGPFEPLMYSPQLMTQARSMGDYLRYKSAIGNTLSEFTILLTAREWTQDYEWYVHHPIAIKSGIKPEVAAAIADGRRPSGLSEDEEIIYAYVSELQRNHQVSDATFDRARARFGEKGILDIGGIVGYYTLLAIELNAARYPIPADAKPLPRLPR